MKRFVYYAEIPLLYVFVLLILWCVPKELRLLATLTLFAYVGWSWKMAGDTARTLGLRPSNLLDGLSVAACIVLANVGIVTWIHNQWCPTAGSNWGARGICLSAAIYFLWALAQQLLVCGYFANRIFYATKSTYLMCWGTALAFSLAHFPNGVLMALTFVNGVCCALFFRRYRNLYVISTMHVLVAVYSFMLFPYAWHHGFRIGRGYWY